MSTTSINITAFADDLKAFRQSGDICAFLNVTLQLGNFGMDNELTSRFVAFHAAGFNLSTNPILEWLIPSILSQFTVVKCSFQQHLAAFKSESVQNYFADMEANGFTSTVLPMLVLPSTFAMLAVLLNISFLITTVKNIPMSTMCNWLLAFDSCCQIPALLPFLINLFAICARLAYVDYQVCLASHMLSTGAVYASFAAVYSMSVERLLAVLVPMPMSQMGVKDVRRYSLLTFLFSLCFGLLMILNVFSVMKPSINSNINAAFGSYVYCNTWFYGYSLSMYSTYLPSSHTILGLAVLNYMFIAVIIFYRRVFLPSVMPHSNSNNAYSQATLRMLLSVFIISLILLFGWMTGSLFLNQNEGSIAMLTGNMGRAMFNESQVDADRFSYNSYYWTVGLLTCLFPLAAGMNAPVLIIVSTTYRKAYKKTLGAIFPCLKKTSTAAVAPLLVVHVNGVINSQATVTMPHHQGL